MDRKNERRGFRKCHWGMTQADVLLRETEQLAYRTGSVLQFEGSMFGASCIIEYHFEKDNLDSGVMAFPVHSEEQALPLYLGIRNALVRIYGAPDDPASLIAIGQFVDIASEYDAALMSAGMPDESWNRPNFELVRLRYRPSSMPHVLIEYLDTAQALARFAKRSVADKGLL